VKISIITASYNSEKTINDTINSVLSQTYKNIEYIIIDGNSSDKTKDIVSCYLDKIKFISEPDHGIYDAINKGINLATGDIVGILNSDDFFPNNEIIDIIATTFINNYKQIDLLFGDIAFVNNDNKITRSYSAKNFTNSLFKFGMMPPHPSVYIKREVYLQYGLYITSYKIAADFELLLRYLLINNLKYKYINLIVVYMRFGGVSNSSFKNRLLLNNEILKACKNNKIATNYLFIYSKYFKRILEYITPFFKKR
jgi:glycosyltransferase involved in cell wall biosynthesis